MEPMLTQDDLNAIGTIVKEAVEEVVNDPQGVINTKFDAVQEQLDGIDRRLISVEVSMATKSYIDDKLAHYQRKPF